MLERVLVVGLAGVLAASLAAYLLAPEKGLPDGAPTRNQMADEVGAAIMEHIHRGHVPSRSGEIMLVPKPHRYLVPPWDLTTLGSATPTMASSHPNPWTYLTHVPIVLYGSPTCLRAW